MVKWRLTETTLQAILPFQVLRELSHILFRCEVLITKHLSYLQTGMLVSLQSRIMELASVTPTH